MQISLVVSDAELNATLPAIVLDYCIFWGLLSCTQTSGTNRYLLIDAGYI